MLNFDVAGAVVKGIVFDGSFVEVEHATSRLGVVLGQNVGRTQRELESALPSCKLIPIAGRNRLCRVYAGNRHDLSTKTTQVEEALVGMRYVRFTSSATLDVRGSCGQRLSSDSGNEELPRTARDGSDIDGKVEDLDLVVKANRNIEPVEELDELLLADATLGQSRRVQQLESSQTIALPSLRDQDGLLKSLRQHAWRIVKVAGQALECLVCVVSKTLLICCELVILLPSELGSSIAIESRGGLHAIQTKPLFFEVGLLLVMINESIHVEGLFFGRLVNGWKGVVQSYANTVNVFLSRAAEKREKVMLSNLADEGAAGGKKGSWLHGTLTLRQERGQANPSRLAECSKALQPKQRFSLAVLLP